MTKDPRSYNRPSGHQLKPAHIDNVARALLSLTKDVCILTDRLAILEKVLEDKGIDVSELIDTYEPGDALKAQIQTRTSKTISDVVSALKGD